MTFEKSLSLIMIQSLFWMTGQAQGAETRHAQPTIYQTPILVSDLSTCPMGNPDYGPAQKTMKASNGTELITVCAKVADQCAFDGACLVEQPGQETRGFNFSKYDNEAFETYFGEIDLKRCPYGYGFGFDSKGVGRQTCLDPYFSVAANKKEHRLGEVLFFPTLKGRQLPDGQTHDGYVIIRDSATLFDDVSFDRYSLFVGAHRNMETVPQFLKKDFDNIDLNVPYQIVTGKKAEQVRNSRNYPRVPVISSETKN